MGRGYFICPTNQTPLAILPGDGSLGQSESSHPMLLSHRATPRHSTNHRVKSEPSPWVRQLSGVSKNLIMLLVHHPPMSLAHCSPVTKPLLFPCSSGSLCLECSPSRCEADSFPHDSVQSAFCKGLSCCPISEFIPLLGFTAVKSITHTIFRQP